MILPSFLLLTKNQSTERLTAARLTKPNSVFKVFFSVSRDNKVIRLEVQNKIKKEFSRGHTNT